MALEKFFAQRGRKRETLKSNGNHHFGMSAVWEQFWPRRAPRGVGRGSGQNISGWYVNTSAAVYQIQPKKTSQASVQTDANPGGDVYLDYCRFYKLYRANLQESKNVYGNTLSDISRLTDIEPPACIPSNVITYLWRRNCKLHKTSLTTAGITFFSFF